MHNTLSDKYIGHIDSVTKTGDIFTVTGWVVALSESDDGPVIADSMINYSVTERRDVFDFYKKDSNRFLKSGFVLKLSALKDKTTLSIKNIPVFNINNHLETFENVIRPNLKTKPELIVVDNFYENPDAVRKFAMQQEFIVNESYYKGQRTRSFIPSWVQKSFEGYLGKPIKEFTGATGVFQYCTSKDQVVYHFDSQEYAAMVYLTPDAPLSSGTSTYKSKITNLMHAATDEDVKRLNKSVHEINAASFNGNNFYDSHNMELVDSVANVYNRMVIFNSRALHAATSYFGSDINNGRLFHLYFFNCF